MMPLSYMWDFPADIVMLLTHPAAYLTVTQPHSEGHAALISADVSLVFASTWLLSEPTCITR